MKIKKDFTKLSSKTPEKRNKQVRKSLSRLINLMITLNQGVLNLDHAARENGVSRRTIQRDIETLENAGLPLYKPNPQNLNYCVRKDFEWAKFNITPQNVQDFVDMLDVMAASLGKPCKWVLPIQKEVVKAGRKEQKKREQSRGKWIPMNATKENALSIILQDPLFRAAPLPLMLMLVELNEYADDQFFKNTMYRNWQEREFKKIIARFYWLAQQHAAALKKCQQLIEEDPKDIWPYKQAALVCYTRKDYNGALQYALEGFEQDGKNEELFTYCIYFLILNKQYRKAIEVFNTGVPHKETQTHFAAMMYVWVGLFDKALEVIAQAKKKDPEATETYDKIKEQVLKIKAEKK